MNIRKSLFLLAMVVVTAISGLLPTFAAASAEPFDAANYKGKVVYVDFWASWCVPCRKSFPWLNTLAKKYPDDLVVVGINVDSEPDAAAKFLAKYPAEFKLSFDPQGKVATQYKLEGMPSAVILDRDGKEVHRHVGFREEKVADYEQVVADLIARH